MEYIAFTLNALVLAALVFELHGNRKERQSLALLIKSRDVQEFVRAEQDLARPADVDKNPTETVVDLDSASPEDVAKALGG